MIDKFLGLGVNSVASVGEGMRRTVLFQALVRRWEREIRSHFHHLGQNESQTEGLVSISEMFVEESYIDTLTGVFNRKAFLSGEHAASCDLRIFIAFDLDDFKSINDTYGHVVGDEVLKDVAERIQRFFPAPDFNVFRMGGDEFCVTRAPGPDIEAIENETLEAIDRFYADLSGATVRFEKADGDVVEIMACAVDSGLVTLEKGTKSLQAIYMSADDALYQAKETRVSRGVDMVCSRWLRADTDTPQRIIKVWNRPGKRMDNGNDKIVMMGDRL